MANDATTPVILSAVRTPIGKYLGGLAPFAAPKLGAPAVFARASGDGGDLDPHRA